MSSRTDGGRSLPDYYLVYFLLVDLLQFPHLGAWEKSAWTVPVRYQGRLYGIEHRKMGLGIFAPNLAPDARWSARPTEQDESDAREICKLIQRAVSVAEPYFEWRAERAASGAKVNVVNRSDELLERFAYFRDRYEELRASSEAAKAQRKATSERSETESIGLTLSTVYRLKHEAEWNGQAAVEAFFSWTEHAFIHIAILLGRLRTGDEVAKLAEGDWKAKYKAALDLDAPESKRLYDELLDIRAQMRNFMAHGAFGKRGEAFSFHSGAGAVPVLITRRLQHRYALTGRAAFDERAALSTIDEFFKHLWSGAREPAKLYLESNMPSILTYASDGTYADAMSSVSNMEAFLEGLIAEHDRAANMDW